MGERESQFGYYYYNYHSYCYYYDYCSYYRGVGGSKQPLEKEETGGRKVGKVGEVLVRKTGTKQEHYRKSLENIRKNTEIIRKIGKNLEKSVVEVWRFDKT